MAATPGVRPAFYNGQQMTLIASSLPSIDWHWLWLSVAAFLAGVLNAVAGGGSFLLFPAMLGMKMLPVQANATNTVALWPGQLTSVAAYREDISRNRRLALPMGLAGLLGGTAGDTGVAEHSANDFSAPGALVTAGSRIDLCRHGPGDALAGPPQVRGPHRSASAAAAVSLAWPVVCFYVGYFGAGAGFLLITLLSLFGFQDLNEINALKVVATTMANGVAFLIFVIGRQVEWRYCLLAMVTCAVGGYTSARFARRIPQPFLRGIVIVIGFSMAAWFFWRNS